MKRRLEAVAMVMLPVIVASPQAIAQSGRDPPTQASDASELSRRADELKLIPRLSGSDRQRAVDYFRDSRNEQLSHVDLSVTIGAAVPRNISLYDLPSAIVSIAPAYRGFRYARSREKVYVIDPATFIVVDVILLGGGATAGLDLSETEIEMMASVLRSAPADTSAPWRLGLGAELPATIALHAFPEDLVGRIPELGSFRYARTGGEIVIADPADRSVVLVIPD